MKGESTPLADLTGRALWLETPRYQGGGSSPWSCGLKGYSLVGFAAYPCVMGAGTFSLRRGIMPKLGGTAEAWAFVLVGREPFQLWEEVGWWTSMLFGRRP